MRVSSPVEVLTVKMPGCVDVASVKVGPWTPLIDVVAVVDAEMVTEFVEVEIDMFAPGRRVIDDVWTPLIDWMELVT